MDLARPSKTSYMGAPMGFWVISYGTRSLIQSEDHQPIVRMRLGELNFLS